MIAAYTRKSTKKETQTNERQMKSINDYALKNGFSISEWQHDIISGKTKAESRPAYKSLKANLRSGDVLIVSDLDRLGRDASDTIVEVKDLHSKGIKLVALDVPYLNEWGNKDNDSLHAMIIDILVTLKAHIAQQEREKTVDRINQGLAAAKEKGVKLGRPRMASLPPQFVKKYEEFLAGKYGKIDHTGLAKLIGVHRSTLYKYIDIYNEIDRSSPKAQGARQNPAAG